MSESAKEPGVTAVRIRRGDRVFHVHGENAGAEGVYLAEGQVQGLYDSPVKTTYKSGAFQVGSRFKGMKRDHRDMVLGFHVIDTATSYEFNESAFRQMFQYQLDPWDVDRTPTVIEVETELSGVRCIDVLMFEQPEFAAAIDPLKQQHGNLLMKLRAANPDWYEPDYTDTFSSDAPSAQGFITVENSTDQVAYQRFVLTQAVWTLPDCQWVGAPAARQPGGELAERAVDKVDIATVSGGAVVDWDRSQLAFRDANDTNLQARVGQRFLMFPIPPHTPPTPLPISYSGAPKDSGAMARLEVPRRWSRPWGMELQMTVSYEPPLGTARFTAPGEFSYEIPPGATHLDVVMLGGGGGGGGGTLITGTGGSAGQWQTVTLERGKEIPMGVAVLRGAVGAGGKCGGYNGLTPKDGEDGFPSRFLIGTGQPQTAPGGLGSGHIDHVSGDDVGPRTINVNGYEYRGGGTRETPGGSGETPGGGGAGGWPVSPGGDGARGQVWIRAYRVEE
jgi:hypothetical protein